MKRMVASIAAAALVTCGAAASLSAAPASAVGSLDIFGALLTGSAAGSSGGNGSPEPGGPQSNTGPSNTGPSNTGQRPSGGPSSNGVVGIDVTAKRADGGYAYGTKIGPGLFTLSDGKFTPAVVYNARTSAGGTNSANNCQIEIQITGPQNSGVIKTAECSGTKHPDRITVTGTYTATVLDRVSGRQGTSSFTIE